MSRRWVVPIVVPIVAAVLCFGTIAAASPVDPVYQDTEEQDVLMLPDGIWHELGDLFPPDELIVSSCVETTLTACPYPPGDSPGIHNVLVSITNLSPRSWWHLHYVTDYFEGQSETLISNFDGVIGNAGLNDMSLAFKIDNVGLNQPLVSESLVSDLIFQPTETWEFIIQDFDTAPFFGLPDNVPPTPFKSIGIASLSGGDVISSGSIIVVSSRWRYLGNQHRP